MLRAYKFQIIPIVQHVDADGVVQGEKTLAQQDGQPMTVFGVEALREFADSFDDQLAKLGEAAMNGQVA